YLHAFRQFLQHIAPRHPNEIVQAELIEYLDQLQDEKPRSASYRNQIINAIKCWYEKAENLDWQAFGIARPRQVKHLPKVLSREEVGRIIRATENAKHQC
ncbi:phage integrase N-terminal SAM-like domain-containing protein, partial [Arthrospira platensis SPKY1]|nr:phage integrase N-terminal SAM-like domain-containing protein [Arthrospira platensis SPKY1]